MFDQVGCSGETNVLVLVISVSVALTHCDLLLCNVTLRMLSGTDILW